MACPKCVGIQGDLWHVPSVRDYRVIYVECVLSVKVYRVIYASCVLEFTGWVMSHVSDSLYKVISHILLSVHYFLMLNNIFILVKMEFDVTSAFNNGKNLQRKQDVLDQVIKNKML
jgi:hypothetical protein